MYRRTESSRWVSGGEEACVVLTTDPKPRLRWTSELHDRFIDAVSQLGGPKKATPKTILRTMGVKGLTLYHLKSHLQKYRMGKQPCKEATDGSKDASFKGEIHDTDSSTSSARMKDQELNDGNQVTEALRVQMEVQRRLHEQLEVPRHLQLRIEAQGKYLHSLVEKACKALSDQAAVSSYGFEAAHEELSELAIRISASESSGLVLPDTIKIPSSFTQVTPLHDTRNAPMVSAWISDCSVDSCLTSMESPVSPLGAMKKRARPVFGNGDMLPVDCSSDQVGWIMANI
ncbi:hypothetical protein RND81_14G051300 [Saponaria officinalis]|uniref:HTH myb-type domain-containing protein n=1 Tax=Saponaria officinalis TaxID=3572 RepID=A0AAW1GL30_SAPOF